MATDEKPPLTMREFRTAQAAYKAALSKYVKDASDENQAALDVAGAKLKELGLRMLDHLASCAFAGD